MTEAGTHSSQESAVSELKSICSFESHRKSRHGTGDSNPKGNPEKPREGRSGPVDCSADGPCPAPQGCQGAGQRSAMQHDLSAGGVFLEATGYGQNRKEGL